MALSPLFILLDLFDLFDRLDLFDWPTRVKGLRCCAVSTLRQSLNSLSFLQQMKLGDVIVYERWTMDCSGSEGFEYERTDCFTWIPFERHSRLLELCSRLWWLLAEHWSHFRSQAIEPDHLISTGDLWRRVRYAARSFGRSTYRSAAPGGTA